MHGRSLLMERLEERALLDGQGLLAAVPLAFHAQQAAVSGLFDQQTAFFSLRITEPSRLIAHLHAEGFDTRLSLLNQDGELLVQSDGQSPHDRDDLLDQHLRGTPEGTPYYLQIESLDGGRGAYELTASFAAARLPFQTLPVGAEPRGIAHGDFNGDGRLDLVSTNAVSGSVSILLGLGDGTFAPAREFPVGVAPLTPTVGDFNGDGFLDLATADVGSNTVSILLGRGDGTLNFPRPFTAGAAVTRLVTGDFNRDGAFDLAAGYFNDPAVAVFLGRGDGTFADRTVFAVGANSYAVVAHDFNGDGLLDLASASTLDSTVSVLLGRGDGTFTGLAQFRVGPGPFGLTSGDFNGDGRTDLATSNTFGGTVSVLLGRGDGTFGDQLPCFAGPGLFALVSGDFNRDGRTDLAAASASSQQIVILLGRGDATFADPVLYGLATDPIALVAADFNADGALDLASANNNTNDVSVLLGRGDGTFPAQGQATIGSGPLSLAAGDFNSDGRLDLAVANNNTTDVAILLGRQDGTFQPQGRFAIGSQSRAIIADDFNDDGRTDLATVNYTSNTVSVLLGRGDGTFADHFELQTGSIPLALVTGDFNGDGRTDLATTNFASNSVSVLLGRGGGTFADQTQFAVGVGPLGLTTGDFEGDGRTDLAVGNAVSGDVSVLPGQGDGSFAVPTSLLPHAASDAVVSGDLNGDGHPDLIAVGLFGSVASAFLGQGDGSFAAAMALPLPSGHSLFRTGDVDQDGRLDLIALNSLGNSVSVYSGRGDGSFHTGITMAVGTGPSVVLPRDFNGDGLLDLATVNYLSSDVSILLGQADGTFRDQIRTAVTTGPVAVAQEDFNSDGRLDLVTAQFSSGVTAIRLGLGDGTFQEPLLLPAGAGPAALATGDFNHDGRADLAVANALSNDLTVSLGLGDGTLQQTARPTVGSKPLALAAGDFDGDGHLDLAAANYESNDVSVLRGLGDGTFRELARIAVGLGPRALALGDFDGDRRPDLAVANYLSRDVSVLRGRGNGTFRELARVVLATGPGSLTAGDFDGDGRLDLAVAHDTSNEVSVLRGRGDGTFGTPARFATGAKPSALVTGDFDGDGRLDLAVANNNSNDVSVLRGQGNGTFQDATRWALGNYPVALAGGDFNNDGRLDLATANQMAAAVSVGLGLGNGTFAASDVASLPIRSKPLVADFNGDGAADVVVLGRDGRILYRQGRPDQPGTFNAPQLINPDPRAAARDLALVTMHGQPHVAVLEARAGALSFYQYQSSGFQRMSGAPVSGFLPVRVVAGDLNGDGLDDLVTATMAPGQVHVYLQHLPRRDQVGFEFFGPATYQVHVGVSPADLALRDVDGTAGPDIVVVDQFSGDVRVLLNDPAAPFTVQRRFRAGTGLVGLVEEDGRLVPRSAAVSTAMEAGDFDGDAVADLLVANAGANRLALLRGSGFGGFLNPESPAAFATGQEPTVVVAGQFNGDSHLDAAVLNRRSGDLSIFLGDGRGGFTQTHGLDAAALSAGNAPSGLAVYDLDADGQLDLLVGNEFGDLLVLPGNGDGTFQPYLRADRNITLAVADLNGDGVDDFVFGNQALDRVTVNYSQPGQRFKQGRQEGLLAPGAVVTHDINGDGRLDLVVANSGGNNVLIYLGLGDGQFGPARAFHAGTTPVGLNLGDVNNDGIVDLVVANAGSNDVSILLGRGRDSAWTFTSGPRLRGGAGPASTLLTDYNHDGLPDLLICNGQSNDVYLLAGVGGGFFNDVDPDVLQAGLLPSRMVVGEFDGVAGQDLVTINSGSNDLSLFSNFGLGRRIASGGRAPVDALVGDFNGDGFDDLVVLHNADSKIALFLTDTDGPRLARLLSRPDLLHPTAIALAGFDAAGLELYVTTEGQEAIAGLYFALDLSPLVPGRESLLLAVQEPAATDFSTLPDSSLGIVATLLTGSLPVPSAEEANLSLEMPLNSFLIGLEDTAPRPRGTVPEQMAGQAETGTVQVLPSSPGLEFAEPPSPVLHDLPGPLHSGLAKATPTAADEREAARHVHDMLQAVTLPEADLSWQETVQRVASGLVEAAHSLVEQMRIMLLLQTEENEDPLPWGESPQVESPEAEMSGDNGPTLPSDLLPVGRLSRAVRGWADGSGEPSYRQEVAWPDPGEGSDPIEDADLSTDESTPRVEVPIPPAPLVLGAALVPAVFLTGWQPTRKSAERDERCRTPALGSWRSCP